MNDFGRTPLTPQIFLSSCRDFWNATLVWSEMLARTYTSVEIGVGRDGLGTHVIQILNEPRQVLALQAWNNTSILVPTEKVDELFGKLWRSSVEVVEFS